jgi:tRNA-2-methylthio-N6-dimethylallyladenosine synthase
MTQEKKKLFIKTWGCQMNVYDSNRMADILSPLGYEPTQEAKDADMVILNTCHIREKATDKVFSDLGRMRNHKNKRRKQGKETVIAVAGCVAQAEGDLIRERAPYVDMIFGPQTYHELPEMIVNLTGERIVNTEMSADSKFDNLPLDHVNPGVAPFVSIQEGCDKFCTFCVVPYTRGPEFSRRSSDIIEEIKRVAGQGAREVTLLGQNVNAYHGEASDGTTWSLGRLIQEVAKIDGIERIRYTTSHPRDVDDELIEAHGTVKQLMPFLHLPVQSGSDKLLKTMNRKHTADFYREIIEKFRKAQPDIAFSSDFIVGFPGETDEDFEATMQLVRDVFYAQCFSFKYSARPGTPAANMQGLIAEKVKDERLQRLQELLNQQRIEFNDNTVGKIVPVLFDGLGNRESQLHGRTPWNQAVHVHVNPRLMGQIIDVRITGHQFNALIGEAVTVDDVVFSA